MIDVCLNIEPPVNVVPVPPRFLADVLSIKFRIFPLPTKKPGLVAVVSDISIIPAHVVVWVPAVCAGNSL